jgi:sporulation protein YlmC with PRC-barrel domain
MKRKLQIITCAAASFLAATALAQLTPSPNPDGTEYSYKHATRMRADRPNGAAKASDVIGMEVQNFQNEKLGKVDDLAVDVESGRIVQVILSTGGFLGIGNTLNAVPPGALQYDATEKALRLDVSKEKLKAAPRFENSNWDEGTQSNRVSEVYVFYGQQVYFANDHGYWTTNSDGTLARTFPRNMDGTINTEAPRNVEKVRNAEIARNAQTTDATPTNSNPDRMLNRERYSNERTKNYSWSSLGYVQKASKLMGASVKNLQDQKLGKVENLVLDLPAGRIVAVIISSGGFLGMGDELSAVPPTALRFNGEHDTLQLDASKELMANSPHFKENRWPDLTQPEYVGGVYRAYQVEPYFATDADNTRQNVRDRDNRTLTPLDQGSSQADRDITAMIRKEIMADKEMSVNARNVKIITRDGKVTLRGPVNSAEEKRRIEDIANRNAHSENVNSQLEVSRDNNNTTNN